MQNNVANLPNCMNLLQNLYTGVVWVDDSLSICWVNTQTEQLFLVSQSRLIGLNILTVLSSTDPLPIEEKEGRDTLADSLAGQSHPQPSKPQPLSAQQAQAHLHQSQLAVQFANAKDYQQPFIEYNRHIVGVVHPVFVNYSVTPVEQEGKTYYLVELWEKNRQSRIDKEHRLQEQHEVAREMLRSVAHEVKNPLAGIRGAAQLLIKQTQRAQKSASTIGKTQDSNTNLAIDKKTGDKVTPIVDSGAGMDNNMMLVDAKKLTTYADIVISETDRLSGLIGQLLGSNQLPQWETINIHEPLEHVLILTQTRHPDVKVVRDYDLSLPELTADKNQLIQVFLNLVNNACEAMLEQDFSNYEAGYQPILRISTRIEYQYTIGSIYHRQVLKVCVHDNGGGIDPDIIDRIFFPLVTGRANGTGLGLALVQEMVHRHCGAIEVNSTLNNTAFCIYLPFSQTDSG